MWEHVVILIILLGISTINHPFWGTPIPVNLHMGCPTFSTKNPWQANGILGLAPSERSTVLQEIFQETLYGATFTLWLFNIAMENDP